jgi:hypothetical protein
MEKNHTFDGLISTLGVIIRIIPYASIHGPYTSFSGPQPFLFLVFLILSRVSVVAEGG